MTIDEAIKYCEEEVERFEKVEGYRIIHNECGAGRYVEEHRQLVEWLKELKQLKEQTKWIRERLPEKFANVLCSTDAEEIFIANYLGKMNDGTDCFDDEDGMMWEGDVIAWMPLPEPYKAESEDKK